MENDNRSTVYQKTIAHSFRVSGRGLHSGLQTTVYLNPAEENKGIFFRVVQGKKQLLIPALVEYACPSSRSTSLSRCGFRVSTVEHLLAACWLADLDNLEVIVEGEEIPGGNGRVSFWLELLIENGFTIQSAPREEILLPEWLVAKNRESFLFAFPAIEFRAWYFLDVIDRSHFAQIIGISEKDGLEEMAKARTFAFDWEIPQILQENIGQGVRDQALILGNLGESAFSQMSGEAAYHKLADLVGDLMLVGVRVRGAFFGWRSGHSLNREMARLIYRLRGIEDGN